jgi:hypothetical protein
MRDSLMIDDFADFCLYMYVTVDDVYKSLAPPINRPGPDPACSDSEVITMALVGECRGWDMETELLSHWGEHRDLFPHLPSQSRFNRRRRGLMRVINVIRGVVLTMLDVAQDSHCTIDSLPIPVVNFHLVPGASREWVMHDAAFGKVPSKKVTIFGYKLHLLVTLSGVIVDFVLAPANANDLALAPELLEPHTDYTVLGDKAYISAVIAAELLRTNRLTLLTLPRANQKVQVSAYVRTLFNAARQIIETINGQLTEQFHIEHNHAHTFQGLCARLYTKLTAHTLCIFINRLLGRDHFLHIKSLAFAN